MSFQKAAIAGFFASFLIVAFSGEASAGTRYCNSDGVFSCHFQIKMNSAEECAKKTQGHGYFIP